MFKELIEQEETKELFREMLGDRSTAFLNTALSLVIHDPQGLGKAEPKSVLNAVSAVASLDLLLDPSFGQSFITCYKVKEGIRWIVYAQFQIGYKGLIELGLRSNQFYTLNTSDVREGEYRGQDRLTGEIGFEWFDDQDERKNKKVVGYVAFFQLTNGFRKSLFMTVKEMQEHAKKWSKTNDSKDKEKGWGSDFDGMGLKTVLKLLLDRYAPKSTEMKKAIKFDQAVIEDIRGEKLNYVDNPNPTEKSRNENLKTSNETAVKNRVLNHIKNSKTIEQLKECESSIKDDNLKIAFDAKVKQLENFQAKKVLPKKTNKK